MMKLRRLKEKKGMTLVELMVGIAVLSVLLISVSAIFLPMYRMQIKAVDYAELNSLIDSLADPIIKDLSCATAPVSGLPATDTVTVLSNGVTIIYAVDSGVLTRTVGGTTTPVFSKSFYKGKVISFVCEAAPVSLLTATAYYLIITVSMEDGGELASRTYAVKPLTLNQYNP